MENKTAPVTGLGLLTIVFITLKLTHHIDWEWWIVLSPVIFPSALALLVVILLILFQSRR
tara:strand:+ start:469 stop:648 length:180 start_codon:yes stop_codon:yes gene_type:complete